jgi:Short C-terminal domain/Phospholipase_D-nuclease N-terminal
MPLLDLLWTMFWFFLFIAWIWLLVVILTDVFRDRDLSGWAKALWTLFVFILPMLGVLIYLIVRGDRMSERSERRAMGWGQQTGDYVSAPAVDSGASRADELDKLARLRNSGTITEEEFQAQKARLLAQA